MTDTETTPLTALCSICHLSPPKYTCPRCAIHTCSLACVTLHKRRAPCSGIRDPTAYRKRGDLVTASGIDSDFNFITGVERSLARRTEEEKEGLGLVLGKRKATDSERLEGLVRERGVRWTRAPQGLKRRRENETRVENGGVSWMVEFTLQGGERKVGLCPDRESVQEAWKIANREPKAQAGRKKRRRMSRHAEEGVNGVKKEAVVEEDRAVVVEEQSVSRDGEAKVDNDIHFYLLRPNTPNVRVLVPIQKTDTLESILRGRVVLEYPTIYVKHESPDQLPVPFMLESTYLTEHGEDITIPSTTKPDTEEDEEEEEEGEIAEQQIAPTTLQALTDPKKLLSVLQQDLTT